MVDKVSLLWCGFEPCHSEIIWVGETLDGQSYLQNILLRLVWLLFGNPNHKFFHVIPSNVVSTLKIQFVIWRWKFQNSFNESFIFLEHTLSKTFKCHKCNLRSILKMGELHFLANSCFFCSSFGSGMTWSFSRMRWVAIFVHFFARNVEQWWWEPTFK